MNVRHLCKRKDNTSKTGNNCPYGDKDGFIYTYTHARTRILHRIYTYAHTLRVHTATQKLAHFIWWLPCNCLEIPTK